MSGARPSQTSASQRRRATILDAARAIIAERSADKLVIADVAERADVSVATIYNLVGTRDRLLIALLDDVAEQVRSRLASEPTAGIDGCVQVVRAACQTVLADADMVRSVLASVGATAPDQWLTEGLELAILERVEAAIAAGELVADLPAASVAGSIQLGFRGALISWVFGLESDDELAPNAELMALHVLSTVVAPDHRRTIDHQLQQLVITTSNLKDRS